MTKHNCDICGCNRAFEVPHARLYTADQPIHICSDCGFVYVRDRRSAEEIAASWSDEVFGEAYTARIPAVRARQTYVADFIDVTLGLAGKQLLDIGAGEGQFLEIARDIYKAKVFGIEPSAGNCATLKSNGIDHLHGTIESANEGNVPVKADIATIMWTLENCQSCNEMITRAHGLLKDGGHIAVATGSRIMVPFKKALHDYLSTRPTDLHSFRFSANALQSLLRKCGFDIVAVNRFQDTEYLTVIGQKRTTPAEDWLVKDDPIKVYDFFDRWHKETIHHR